MKVEAADHLFDVPIDDVFAALQLHRRNLVRWCEATDDDTRDQLLSDIANIALKRTTFSAGLSLGGCGEVEANDDTSSVELVRQSSSLSSDGARRGWVSVSAKQLEYFFFLSFFSFSLSLSFTHFT